MKNTVNKSPVIRPSPLTLESPQLQHYSAALQVVEQALGGVEGGKMYSVIQHGIDVVPHSRRKQRLTAVKQPETDRVEEKEEGDISPKNKVQHEIFYIWPYETSRCLLSVHHETISFSQEIPVTSDLFIFAFNQNAKAFLQLM